MCACVISGACYWLVSHLHSLSFLHHLSKSSDWRVIISLSMHSSISHIYSQRVTESAKIKRIRGHPGAQMQRSAHTCAATDHFGNIIQPPRRIFHELHACSHGVNGGQTNIAISCRINWVCLWPQEGWDYIADSMIVYKCLFLSAVIINVVSASNGLMVMDQNREQKMNFSMNSVNRSLCTEWKAYCIQTVIYTNG